MTIKLPLLYKTSCTNLTACGEIQSGSKAFLNRLSKKETQMVSRCRVGSRIIYLRVMVGGKSGKHLHIDCALNEFFPKTEKPKVTHTRDQVMVFLNEALGATINVGVVGAFFLSLDNLPERGLIRSLYTEQKTGGMTVKVTAGRFSITGAPVRNIVWSVKAQGKDILLLLEADKKGLVEIEEMYLQELLDWIDSQLRIFVLTRGEYGNK